jgi:hypothetical protein
MLMGGLLRPPLANDEIVLDLPNAFDAAGTFSGSRLGLLRVHEAAHTPNVRSDRDKLAAKAIRFMICLPKRGSQLIR